MQRCRVGIAILLLVGILFSLFPISVTAAEDIEYPLGTIRIYNGDSIQSYQVINSNGELYFPVQTYEGLTRYQYTSGNGTHSFQLGKKAIIIDPQNRQMSIPVLHYTGEISSIITQDSTDYLPASEILPWMNVACTVSDGILEIVPDGISIWEIISELNYKDYMFNMYEECGDSVSSVAGLSAMVIFDTIIHLRWDRLIPADGTIDGAASGNSLYDYKCYKDALIKIAQVDPFSGEKAQKVIETAVTVNKGLDTASKVFKLDIDETQIDIDNFIRDSGMGDEIAGQVYELIETWKFLREGVGAYSKIKKYLDLFSILKTYELIVETDEEYRNYLQWLSDEGTDNTLFNNALADTLMTLDHEKGVIHSMFLQLGSALAKDLPEGIAEAIVNNSMNDTLIGAYNSYAGSIFSSLDTYMGIADVIYSKVIPISSGFEGVAKSGVIETIQDHCWSLANSLQREEITSENIAHIRQSYLCALQAAKMNYEAMQDLIDVKLFDKITLLDGEGLLDYKFDAIDEKLLQLVSSADATENDSIDGKKEFATKIKEMFVGLTITQVPDNNFAEIEYAILLNALRNAGVTEITWDLADADYDGTRELFVKARTSNHNPAGSLMMADSDTGAFWSYAATGAAGSTSWVRFSGENDFIWHDSYSTIGTQMSIYSVWTGWRWEQISVLSGGGEYDSTGNYVFTGTSQWKSEEVTYDIFGQKEKEFVNTATLTNPDLSSINIEGSHSDVIARLDDYLINRVGYLTKLHGDVDGDTKDESLYLLKYAANQWFDVLSVQNQWGDEKHIGYKDETVTAILVDDMGSSVNVNVMNIDNCGQEYLLSGNILKIDGKEYAYSNGRFEEKTSIQEFLTMTSNEIKTQIFSKPYDVYYWFTGNSFAGATSENEKVVVDGKPYYRILDGEYRKYSDMISYAENYFSKKLLDDFVAKGSVLDIEGNLYQFNPGYGGPYDPGYPIDYYIDSHTDEKIVYCRCSKYPKDPWTSKTPEQMTDEEYNTFYAYYVMELIDGRWIFTGWEQHR